MRRSLPRRRFIGNVIAAGVATGATSAVAQQAGRVRGFDHVALPMQNTKAMLPFYRRLGFDVVEGPTACSVYIGEQMINFHLPAHWQDEAFKLRAPAAKPPCGDLCFVWDGTGGRAERHARSGRRQNYRRSGAPPRRPEEGGFKRICAGPGWEPAGIHDLCVSHP